MVKTLDENQKNLNSENTTENSIKISPLEKLQNENRSLLKKIDYFQNLVDAKKINPSELENKVSKLDAELKNMVRENAHMASVIGSLYKSRKVPLDEKEYSYILDGLKEKVKILEDAQKKFQKMLMDNEETIEQLQNELGSEKQKHVEDNKKLQDSLAKQKKDNETKLKEDKNKYDKELETLKEQTSKLKTDLEDTKRMLDEKNNKIIELDKINVNLEKEKSLLTNKLSAMDQELKSITEIYKRHKEDKNLLKNETTTKNNKDTANLPEEYNEMNKLIASFLKERKLPDSNKETNALISQYKLQIKELQRAPTSTHEVSKLSNDIKEKNEIIEKLKSESRKNALEAENYKELAQKLKSDLQESKKIAADNLKKPIADNELQNELNEMSKLIATLLKERRQFSNDQEAKFLVQKEYEKIERLKKQLDLAGTEQKMRELEVKVNELKSYKEKAESFENETKILTSVVDKLKTELAESKKMIAIKQDNADKGPVSTGSYELDEMNKLVASFLKERRLPTNVKETQLIMEKHKREIKELKDKLANASPSDNMKKEIIEKNETIDKLKQGIDKSEEELKAHKELIHKLKVELQETKIRASQAVETSAPSTELQKEFDDMSQLVASLIKERKSITGSDESKFMIEKYKKEINNLKEKLNEKENSPKIIKLQERIQELENEVKKTKETTNKEVIRKADSELVVNLKKENENLKVKLETANNKLALYGEDKIE